MVTLISGGDISLGGREKALGRGSVSEHRRGGRTVFDLWLFIILLLFVHFVGNWVMLEPLINYALYSK